MLGNWVLHRQLSYLERLKNALFCLRYHNTLCNFANTKCNIEKLDITISQKLLHLKSMSAFLCIFSSHSVKILFSSTILCYQFILCSFHTLLLVIVTSTYFHLHLCLLQYSYHFVAFIPCFLHCTYLHLIYSVILFILLCLLKVVRIQGILHVETFEIFCINCSSDLMGD